MHVDIEEVASDEKSFPPAEENSNVSTMETNGIDNEDSINLDIGEDEENLLGEEVCASNFFYTLKR